MARQRLNSTARGGMAGLAVIAAMGTATLNATADPGANPPAPTTSAQALQQYKTLSAQTEKIQQSFLKAQDDLKASKQDLAKANGDAAKAAKDEQAAKAQENQFRGQVDQLSDASLQGAQFSKLSALMAGGSAQDYLDRASALRILSSENDTVLNQFAGATNRATAAQAAAGAAQHRAQDATNAANQLVANIQHQRATVKQQVAKAKDALEKLSPSAKASLSAGTSDDSGVYLPGSGSAAGAKAMEAALQQIGVPYVWAGATPSGFDCSGLTMYAFNKAGVSLPHSAAGQSEIGQAVPWNSLQPGDLVFYGSPAYHVGIYVGGGKFVNAPDSGETVRVQPLDRGNFSGGRRVG